MIVFDLSCTLGHRFEGWFASSEAYADQIGRGLVACPHCGSVGVEKAPMAPAVPAKGNARTEVAGPALSNALPPEVAKAVRALADAQARALKESTWVGTDFAEQSRAMHYGERDHATIHGQASPDEARALVEEGIPIAPLPFPLAPPDELN
ncbi:hypothetical protein A6F68_02198 [Tsuneonella dongtanensis]|uniref:Uncharacterized protein n=1 Tax=Tsuneonella dongtanensis TaxID=692370 RepID=A0A1B2AF29_9SPHN|nr:DUF1178 family protein [Tsuneonella dongtanensis]ANY20698.1 hypothetical protein A6F68_02198 [Tsuneonella dongtanensis]